LGNPDAEQQGGKEILDEEGGIVGPSGKKKRKRTLGKPQTGKEAGSQPFGEFFKNLQRGKKDPASQKKETLLTGHRIKKEGWREGIKSTGSH